MDIHALALTLWATAPLALMAAAGLVALTMRAHGPAWRTLVVAAAVATILALPLPFVLALHLVDPSAAATGLWSWLTCDPLQATVAALVQFLGTVIIVFSRRYLEGEPRQGRYVASLAGVLAAVHLLLLANHWLLLIAAWALAGLALHHLLCFYPARPFARLAAHKKRLADRLADVLLIAAAGLATWVVGDARFSALWAHIAQDGAGWALQMAAGCVVLAVILRTALFPVHGWLIQVMEAPTPVSALLHAGVVNLGGYLLIRFAPLLEAAPAARWLLVAAGLVTVLLAGSVMLTRVSIKVRLAWSTVAQMGFMVVECGLGLYTLALLHLLGHSLYKAHAFLSASSVVQQTRLGRMHATMTPSHASLLAAPLAAGALVAAVQAVLPGSAWPWWWSGVLALAWAPLFWIPAAGAGHGTTAWRLATGSGLVLGLTALAALAHLVPVVAGDAPHHSAGLLVLLGMGLMYALLAALQVDYLGLQAWRRRSYAGFYVDEFYTRLALRIWPTPWSGASATAHWQPATTTTITTA